MQKRRYISRLINKIFVLNVINPMEGIIEALRKTRITPQCKNVNVIDIRNNIVLEMKYVLGVHVILVSKTAINPGSFLQDAPIVEKYILGITGHA